MSNPHRPTVLALTGAYLPGFRGGGPIKSLANLAQRLGQEIDFRVITSDRDLGERRAYAGIRTGVWQACGKAQVLYLSPGRQRCLGLASWLNRTPHSVLYLNSLFHPVFTLRPLWLRRTGRIPSVPCVLAPRGELAAGALQGGRFKKRLFLALARRLGIYGGVTFQATSQLERDQIRLHFGDSARIVLAANLPSAAEPPTAWSPKRRDRLRLVSLCRIVPVKNLESIARMLSEVRGRVSWTVYGILQDPHYWRKVQRLCKRLSDHVAVDYAGPLRPGQVGQRLSHYDLFILPSLGENFGHAILESLQSGLPVLISDRTPWRDLPRSGAGWDLPLSELERFREVLRGALAMSNDQWLPLRHRALKLASRNVATGSALDVYRSLFGAERIECRVA